MNYPARQSVLSSFTAILKRNTDPATTKSRFDGPLQQHPRLLLYREERNIKIKIEADADVFSRRFPGFSECFRDKHIRLEF